MENLIEQLKKQHEANLELINKINEEKNKKSAGLPELTESQMSELEDVIAEAISSFDFDGVMEKEFSIDWNNHVTCEVHLDHNGDLASHILWFITKQQNAK